MKELEPSKQDKVEVHAQRQVEKQKHLKRITLHPGHKMWELDLATKLIKEAEYDDEYVEVTKFGSVKRRKLVIKENHLYCGALNQHNADKHFIKMIYGKSLKEVLKEDQDAKSDKAN